MSLLELHDLRVEFRTSAGTVRALRGLSFALERGEILGLVGETGCGKSVTGLAIAGLIPAPGRMVGGEVLLDGEDLTAKNPEELGRIRGRRIGMVFQDPDAALNPVFTIGEQLEMVLKAHAGVGARNEKDRVLELLADVDLPDPAQTRRAYPHQLSGGMQQRAMIAMALAGEPDLLIADEPTTALDVTVQAQILRLLTELRERWRIAVVLISHDLAVVADTCDRVAVLYAGRVVEEGPALEVFSDPRHPYTRGLLGALPVPERRRKELVTVPGSVPTGLTEPAGCSFAPRCPDVMDRCHQVDPPPFALGAGRRAECLLYDEHPVWQGIG